MTREIGICGASDTLSRTHVHLQLTRLPDAEKFVGVPTDDAAGQATPTPLHDATKGLRGLAKARFGSEGGRRGSYQRFSQAQFLRQPCTRVLRGLFVRRLEEVADKVAGSAGVGRGAEREEQEGDVECCGN